MLTSTTPAAAGRPWLSVLVPVYRVEEYLAACVESVVSQADDGVEVLLLDDASPDGSADVAMALCRSHPGQLRLMRLERNEGLSAARNTLQAHANGDYIWHLDSDDIMLPGAIPRLRDVVAEFAPDLVLCDYRMVRERFWLKHRLRGELHRRSFDGSPHRLDSDRSRLVAGLMRARQMHAWTKIARREVWQGVRFPQGRVLLQDVAAMPALTARVNTYVYVAEPWIGYRQHAGSALAAADPAKIPHALRSLRDLKPGMDGRQGLDEEARFAVDYFCLRTMASIARKLPSLPGPGGDTLDAECRIAMAEIFPGGTDRLLAACRARGWGLRAWRLRRTLRRREWI